MNFRFVRYSDFTVCNTKCDKRLKPFRITWHYSRSLRSSVWSLILKVESFNSNGKQLHQYQQNKQLHLTTNHSTWKKPRHMTLEIKVLTWERHKYVAGLNRWMRSQPSHLLFNIICENLFGLVYSLRHIVI